MSSVLLSFIGLCALGHGHRPIRDAEFDPKVSVTSYAFYGPKDSGPLTSFAELVAGPPQTPSRGFFDVEVSLSNAANDTQEGYVALYFTKIGSHTTTIPRLCRLPHSTPRRLVANDSIIVKKFARHSVAVAHSFSLTQGSVDLSISRAQKITKSGVWVAVAEICPKQPSKASDSFHATVSITGHNPYGRLSGQWFYAIPTTLLLTVSYMVMSFVWLGLMLKWKSSLLPHHWLIFLGIELSCFEALFRFFSLRHTNIMGDPASISPLYAFHTGLKVALAVYLRVLLGFGSCGVGIATPRATRDQKIFVAVYTVAYMFVFATLEWQSLRCMLHQIEYHPYYGWLVVLSLLDGGFFWWCFEHMVNVIENLTSASQFAKYHMYRRIGAILFVVCALSIVGCLGELQFLHSQWFTKASLWPLYYFSVEGYWRLVLLGGTVSVAWVLRPHEHAKRYMYSAEIPKTENDDTAGAPQTTARFDFDQNRTPQYMAPQRMTPAMDLTPEFRDDGNSSLADAVTAQFNYEQQWCDADINVSSIDLERYAEDNVSE